MVETQETQETQEVQETQKIEKSKRGRKRHEHRRVTTTLYVFKDVVDFIHDYAFKAIKQEVAELKGDEVASKLKFVRNRCFDYIFDLALKKIAEMGGNVPENLLNLYTKLYRK